MFKLNQPVCFFFIFIFRKNANFTRNQHFFNQFRIVLAKDFQIRRKSAVFLPFWSSFPERLPISQENGSFLTILVIFPRKITKFTGNQHFFTISVIFPRKITNFTGNQRFSYHFGHLSQKDYQIRSKTAVFLPFWSSFSERLPISQEISNFFTNFVLFWQNNSKFILFLKLHLTIFLKMTQK